MFKSTPLWGLLVIGSMQAALAQAPDDTPAQLTPPATASQQQREIAKGDPPRWYREDSTPAAQLRTLQKEIGAALQESTLACKKRPASERGDCMKQARSTYQQDMANAKQIRDENNRVQ